MKMARCLKSVMALLMAFVLVVPINSMVCMASKTNDAYQVMNAEAYDEASGTYALGTDQTTNDTYVKDISADNTYFIYKGVDFGEDMQSEKLTIRGSSGRSSESQPSVIIEIREGTKDGALLGTVDFIVTGGWFNFQEQTFDFNGLTGTHDLCFVFKKAGMYFDYFQFTGKKTSGASTGKAQQFMDCFQPMPIIGTLSSDLWGCEWVGDRDPKNGLEDVTVGTDSDNTKWTYWDGGIIKDESTGVYHMFASRWYEKDGFGYWFSSKIVHATSTSLEGPYIDEGNLKVQDSSLQNPDGHNVFPFKLKAGDENGKYAIITSDRQPGRIWVSDDLNGSWKKLGDIILHDKEGNDITAAMQTAKSLANICILVRPDGKYEFFNRHGQIGLSDNVLGPYIMENVDKETASESYPATLWKTIRGLPSDHMEDPVIWYSDGLYNCTVNQYNERRAYHLTSKDGITDWKLSDGYAYTATQDFLQYTDGTVNRWNKLERPYVYMENGKPVAFTLAVNDYIREQDYGNDEHASKIIVVPFDGEKANQFAKEQNATATEEEGIFPIADTSVQNWGNDQKQEYNLNYGKRGYLRVKNRKESTGTLFGETQTNGSDCKIGFLQFDISQYDLSKLEKATLTLTYTASNNSGDYDGNRIQVALAGDNWTEGIGSDANEFSPEDGGVTWNTMPELLYNKSDLNTLAYSESFNMSDTNTELVIDITKLVKKKDTDAKVLSLAFTGEKDYHDFSVGSIDGGINQAPMLKISLTEDSGASDVIYKISQIGAVEYSETCKARIDAAKAAYDKLSDTQKALVTNAKALTEAVEAYNKLAQEAEAEKAAQEAAKEVADKISGIGTVEYTETCKARIDAAKAAYDKLSDTQKALVTNAKALTEAVEAYNKLDQEQKKLVEENEVPGDTGGSGDTGSTYEQPKKNNDNIPIEDSQIKEGKVYSNGDYSYKVTSLVKRTATVTGAKKNLKKLRVYDSVVLGGKTYRITIVSDSAFKNNKKAVSAVIGRNVKMIGKKAFYGCRRLRRVTFKSNLLKSVGKKAFAGIYKKAKIKAPVKKRAAYRRILKKSRLVKGIKVR